MHYEGRHCELLKVRNEVGLGEGDDAVVVRLDAPHHSLPPPILNDALRCFRARSVVTVEGSRRQIDIELRPVGGDLCLETVKYFLWQATRVGRGLDHNGWDRADEHGLGNSAFTMTRYITRHLTASGGVTDVHRVLQVEVRGQCCEVIGVMIHIVPVADLA